MNVKQLLWTAWALVPVGLLAFHFGPGRDLARRDVAARAHGEAVLIEERAIAAQDDAHRAHLVAIAARREAMLADDPAADARSAEAAAAETAAYARASEAWGDAAEAFESVAEQLGERAPREADRVTLARARALVRAGDIWTGASELEDLLRRIGSPDAAGDPAAGEIARRAREELAGAHYYGARLLRLAGEPAVTWRAEALKARQHFRLLAERAQASGDGQSIVRGFEDNVERVLDLEQQDRSVLEGTPLPRESPRLARGRPQPGDGEPRRSRRPPGERDGRGASGAGEIGRGW